MLSTIAVVVVVLVVLLVPVVLIVNDANDGDTPTDQFVRLAVIAIVALIAAAVLAAVQARQLALPLERLARSAARVGDGDFSAPSSASGIEEIDDIARALRLSANRVDRMLESERSFTADATHQLRTGLTGIAMRLELLERDDDPEIAREARAALEQTHELTTTLDELLAVARRGSSGERTEIDLVALVDHHVSDWQERFATARRQIVVTTGRPVTVTATPGLVGQIVNVLFDNSLRHGAGTLTVEVEGEMVTIEDEGPGVEEVHVAGLFERPADPHAKHGRGLPLARRLAQADGGRLDLVGRRPARFRLTLVPAAPPAGGVDATAEMPVPPDA